LIDPDTKESLGREEAKVGKVKITQVNPKTSTAQIMEDTALTKARSCENRSKCHRQESK